MILLDIGNTHTRIAQSDGATVRIMRTLPTAELTAADLPQGERIAAASVVPQTAKRLSDLKQRMAGYPFGPSSAPSSFGSY